MADEIDKSGEGPSIIHTIFTKPPETMAESIAQTKRVWEHEYVLAIEFGRAKITVDRIIEYGCPVLPEGRILQKKRD